MAACRAAAARLREITDSLAPADGIPTSEPGLTLATADSYTSFTFPLLSVHPGGGLVLWNSDGGSPFGPKDLEAAAIFP